MCVYIYRCVKRARVWLATRLHTLYTSFHRALVCLATRQHTIYIHIYIYIYIYIYTYVCVYIYIYFSSSNTGVACNLITHIFAHLYGILSAKRGIRVYLYLGLLHSSNSFLSAHVCIYVSGHVCMYQFWMRANR